MFALLSNNVNMSLIVCLEARKTFYIAITIFVARLLGFAPFEISCLSGPKNFL